MKPGEKFELEALNYLVRNFSSKSVSFFHGKTSDSTRSDIEVRIDGRTAFFIEAKDTAAQSGQFVLIPDTENKIFNFSPRNKSIQNEFTFMIINHMNYNFDRYNSAGTRGEKIEIDTDIFADWIMDYYAHKNAAFFITKKNDFIIFPTERLKHYLKISAKFRIKKSGSSEPSRKYTDAVKNIISAEYPSTQFFNNGKKLFADIPETVSDVRFSLQKYDYIL